MNRMEAVTESIGRLLVFYVCATPKVISGRVTQLQVSEGFYDGQNATDLVLYALEQEM